MLEIANRSVPTLGTKLFYDAENTQTTAAEDLTPSPVDGTLNGSVLTGGVWTFDKVNDFINIDGAEAKVAGDTEGYISIWAKPASASPTGSGEGIFSLGDTSANERLLVFLDTAGKLSVSLNVLGIGQTMNVKTDNIELTDNTWVHILCVQDGTPELFLDGIAPAQTVTGTSQSDWVAAATNLDNARIGCLDFNAGGNILFFDGEVKSVKMGSVAPTAAQALEIYNIEKIRFGL